MFKSCQLRTAAPKVKPWPSVGRFRAVGVESRNKEPREHNVVNAREDGWKMPNLVAEYGLTAVFWPRKINTFTLYIYYTPHKFRQPYPRTTLSSADARQINIPLATCALLLHSISSQPPPTISSRWFLYHRLP